MRQPRVFSWPVLQPERGGEAAAAHVKTPACCCDTQAPTSEARSSRSTVPAPRAGRCRRAQGGHCCAAHHLPLRRCPSTNAPAAGRTPTRAAWGRPQAIARPGPCLPRAGRARTPHRERAATHMLLRHARADLLRSNRSTAPAPRRRRAGVSARSLAVQPASIPRGGGCSSSGSRRAATRRPPVPGRPAATERLPPLS
jgi:hypothetical protein